MSHIIIQLYISLIYTAKDTNLQDADLETIIRGKFLCNLERDLLIYLICCTYVNIESKKSGNIGLFNNSGQVWNHNFYWNCMKPNGGGEPTGKIKDMINQSFGSYENFRNEFLTAGNTQFASGWAWLVLNPSGGELRVTKTPNADSPLTDEQQQGSVPLLTMVRCIYLLAYIVIAKQCIIYYCFLCKASALYCSASMIFAI